jgi:hypothetical protein
MVPYLKEIHQTLGGWRPYRDKDGWKLMAKEITSLKRHKGGSTEAPGPPKRVKAAVRLWGDVRALEKLLSFAKPPKRRIRSNKTVEVFYGFGDALGVGACTAFQKIVNEGT